MILDQTAEGYPLHSFQFSMVFTDQPQLIHKIVAVFERDEIRGEK